MRIVSAVALAAAFAMPALAFGGGAGDKGPEKRICKIMTRPASHLVDRICMTAAKWEERRAANSIGGAIRNKSGDKILETRAPFPTIK